VIVEQRRYSLVPGGVARYLPAWRRIGRDAQVRHLGEPLGVYAVEVGALNTLVFLWGFENAGDRERRRAALAEDQDFAEFRRSVRELMTAQHTEILIPQPTADQPSETP
jgi:hypothetical protein